MFLFLVLHSLVEQHTTWALISADSGVENKNKNFIEDHMK
jgi:hypothetical protein